ncbi:MAG: hypothetical protein DELT_00493 [Desulfovibrio sp.]
MSYKNAHDVLPPHLLNVVQQYIDGEYIYIPRRVTQKKPWGANTETRERLRARNKAIVAERMAGRSVEELASQYFLSAKAIYKIIKAAQNG